MQRKLFPTLKIRAHHLLCLQGFQGHGYDTHFSNHLDSILKNIDKNFYHIKLEISDSADSICEACPHLNHGTCHRKTDAEKRIKKMDQLVLDKLGLANPTTWNADALFALTNARFSARETLKEICEGCEWQNKCLWYGRFNLNSALEKPCQDRDDAPLRFHHGF